MEALVDLNLEKILTEIKEDESNKQLLSKIAGSLVTYDPVARILIEHTIMPSPMNIISDMSIMFLAGMKYAESKKEINSLEKLFNA